MSVTYWWFSRLLTPADEQHFQPLFAEADRKAGLWPADEEALRYWETHLERFSSTWAGSASCERRKRQGEWYNRFVWAFNRPGFTELATEATRFLSEDNCFRFVVIHGTRSARALSSKPKRRAAQDRLPAARMRGR